MPANKTDKDTSPITGIGNNSEAELKRINARLDELEEQKAEIADDLKDVWREVKSTGFDVKVLRALRAMLKQDKAERDEIASLIDTYAEALGVADLI